MFRSNYSLLRTKYIFTFIALFAFSKAALCDDILRAQEVKISVAKVGQNFLVTIMNISNRKVKINKSLSSDPLIGSIHFVIKEDGHPLPLVAQINSPTPTASSYFELDPGAFYGGIYDVSHVKRMYGAKKQCYSVQVMYADKFAAEYGALSDSISSSEIRVCDSLKSKVKKE